MSRIELSAASSSTNSGSSSKRATCTPGRVSDRALHDVCASSRQAIITNQPNSSRRPDTAMQQRYRFDVAKFRSRGVVKSPNTQRWELSRRAMRALLTPRGPCRRDTLPRGWRVVRWSPQNAQRPHCLVLAHTPAPVRHAYNIGRPTRGPSTPTILCEATARDTLAETNNPAPARCLPSLTFSTTLYPDLTFWDAPRDANHQHVSECVGSPSSSCRRTTAPINRVDQIFQNTALMSKRRAYTYTYVHATRLLLLKGPRSASPLVLLHDHLAQTRA